MTRQKQKLTVCNSTARMLTGITITVMRYRYHIGIIHHCTCTVMVMHPVMQQVVCPEHVTAARRLEA